MQSLLILCACKQLNMQIILPNILTNYNNMQKDQNPEHADWNLLNLNMIACKQREKWQQEQKCSAVREVGVPLNHLPNNTHMHILHSFIFYSMHQRLHKWCSYVMARKAALILTVAMLIAGNRRTTTTSSPSTTTSPTGWRFVKLRYSF